jgi:hypothetical protein
MIEDLMCYLSLLGAIIVGYWGFRQFFFRRYQATVRTDTFYFHKTKDGDILRTGQRVRNILFLIFLSSTQIGLAWATYDVLSKEKIEWGPLIIFLLMGVGVGWLMWQIFCLIRIKPLFIDSATKTIKYERDGLIEHISFSNLVGIMAVYVPNQHWTGGMYTISFLLRNKTEFPLTNISAGAKEAATRRMEKLTVMLKEATGVKIVMTGWKRNPEDTTTRKRQPERQPPADNLTLIAENLRRLQQEGGEENFVIFEADPNANYYIQFAGQMGGLMLIGEAVENEVISEGYKLGDEQIQRLVALGWEYREHTGMNYSQSWQAVTEEDREMVARVVLQTFERVYGVDVSMPLEVSINLE